MKNILYISDTNFHSNHIIHNISQWLS